jgi:hypothetical protein
LLAQTYHRKREESREVTCRVVARKLQALSKTKAARRANELGWVFCSQEMKKGVTLMVGNAPLDCGKVILTSDTVTHSKNS